MPHFPELIVASLFACAVLLVLWDSAIGAESDARRKAEHDALHRVYVVDCPWCEDYIRRVTHGD